MAKTTHGLPETKGIFNAVGRVDGVCKDSFFTSKPQANDLIRNTLKFGLSTSTNNEIYIQVSDSEKEYAYFYNKGNKDKKIPAETKKVPWNERHEFNEEGFNLIGCIAGIEQTLDEDGKKQNLKKTLTPFDMAEYLNDLSMNDKFVDGMELRVMGNIEFSSFDGKNGEKIRFKKFSATKIYNSKVDFEKNDFVEECDFKQTFVYLSSENKEDDEGKYALIKGKVVTYNSVEDADFIIRNRKLAMNFSKKLKPYTAITVYGSILNKPVVEDVQEDDWGGKSDPFEKANSAKKFEMLIEGIKTESIDTKTYTKEKIEAITKAKDDFGKDLTEDDDWGSDDGDDGEWD